MAQARKPKQYRKDILEDHRKEVLNLVSGTEVIISSNPLEEEGNKNRFSDSKEYKRSNSILHFFKVVFLNGKIASFLKHAQF